MDAQNAPTGPWITADGYPRAPTAIIGYVKRLRKNVRQPQGGQISVSQGGQISLTNARAITVPAISSIREKTGLSQATFARLLGVSVRTLQEWEQGRRAPSGAARTLLAIAAKNPQALLDVA